MVIPTRATIASSMLAASAFLAPANAVTPSAVAPSAVAPSARVARACGESVLPISALAEMAAGRLVGGKKVGAGWDYVVLGTVTEVRHKSPKFRYRITMRVDSVLGGDLPALYTFFGSSKGTYPFETGRSYAVPLTKRGSRGPLLPTTELWVATCSPLVVVADLTAAHEVIARTKPGYRPSPSPSPSPSATETETSPPAEPTPEVEAAAKLTPVRTERVSFPSQSQLSRGIRLGVGAVGGLALLIALIAGAESWWSRRRHARA